MLGGFLQTSKVFIFLGVSLARFEIIFFFFFLSQLLSQFEDAYDAF